MDEKTITITEKDFKEKVADIMTSDKMNKLTSSDLALALAFIAFSVELGHALFDEKESE